MIDEPKFNLNKLTDGGCRRLPGPCEYDGCRYNLHGERVLERGLAIQVIEEPCVLKVVEQSGERTLEQVGKMLGCTRERIRQVEAQALWNLGAGLQRAGIAMRGEVAVRRVGKGGRSREAA